jgi:ubiquinone/menaquinone biosynthesis C-methylase UbiE
MSTPTTSNAQQAEYWTNASERWIRNQEALDRALEPFGRAALERAALMHGERVVDVGCGCGATTLDIAARVGDAGAVVGIDLSEPMLGVARKRGAELGNLSWVHGDAATWRADAAMDLVYSRFGVMFFEDPVAAFGNLRESLRSDGRGRLCFVCWRALEQNPWAKLPLDAVMRAVPASTDWIAGLSGAPGPFAFADAGHVERVVRKAGFVDVSVGACDADMVLAPTQSDGGVLEAAVEFAMQAGPVARLLAEAGEDAREQARREIAAELAGRVTGRGVALAGATWLVTAVRS